LCDVNELSHYTDLIQPLTIQYSLACNVCCCAVINIKKLEEFWVGEGGEGGKGGGGGRGGREEERGGGRREGRRRGEEGGGGGTREEGGGERGGKGERWAVYQRLSLINFILLTMSVVDFWAFIAELYTCIGN
jgi:hypothetical protein